MKILWLIPRLPGNFLRWILFLLMRSKYNRFWAQYRPLEQGLNIKFKIYATVGQLCNSVKLFLFPNFSIQLDILRIFQNMYKIKQGKSMDEFSKNQMLQIIIEHIKFLCGILKTPSYDIVLGEFLLSLYMKMFYDDYHRRCTNNFILKGNQLEKTLTFTKNRIREKL